MADIDYREYEKMSPFEIKDGLMKLAKRSAQKSTNALLNAGRGNPNWIATTPREGFFLFGQFALTESRRTMDNPAAGLGGMPQMKGIAARFDAWLAKHAEDPGADFLSRMVEHGVKMFGFDADAFVFELTDSIIGDNYPVPDRMLVHAEQVAHRYLMWAMGANAPIGKFDLYAVEGGTAAMCYIFKSLIANRILKKGDTIAMGTPIFTPISRLRNSRTMRSRPSMSERRRSTASSIPTRRSASSRTRRSRHSSSSIRAIRRRWQSIRRR